MKKHLFFALTLCSAVLFTGCKSQESAYRQAYERARAQESTPADNDQSATVTVPVQTPQTEVTPVTTVTTPVATPGNANVDHSDVRTIPGGFTVVSGAQLKAYSVVVGSFVTQANAEGLASTLKGRGYDARVVKTNETINNQTGWFRVIAASYDDKASAAQQRDALSSTYAGAWLLYNK